MKSKGKTVTGRRERRAFSAEFKAEAVRMVAERRTAGVPLTQIRRELDVRPELLRAWTRAERERTGAGAAILGESVEQEVRRLRRENAVLRQEQAFAKKPICGERVPGGTRGAWHDCQHESEGQLL